jgi:putative peptidoglycan lipid II flippase
MSVVKTESMHRRIAVATMIVTASVLLSRVLGFFREWVLAHQIGANATTDAYNAAFTLPDFLNYLIAGGALSVTFIPVFAKYVAEDREDQGWHVFSTVVTVMGFVVVALVAIGEIFASPIVKVIVPGFNPPEHALAVFLTRLMLPAQIFFYEGSILSAVQYAKGKFLVPSLAPIVYNSCIVLGGLLLASRIGITGFAVGVLSGAFLGNFLLQIYGAGSVGAIFSPNFTVNHPGFRFFLKLSIPIMLALGLTFADDWIMRHYASFLVHGSITWLTYGKNLMRVPLGLVGQAIGVASFPILAQLYSEKKYEQLNQILNSTFKALIFILVPISAFTIAESLPLVHVVFAHTRLNNDDFHATAIALSFFSVGMFAWGAQNILARGFYATRNTITPAVVGTLMTVISLPLYRFLMARSQYRGLALASSIGIIAYTIVLFVLLIRRTQNHKAGALMLFFARVSAASVGAGVACYALGAWAENFLPWSRPIGALAVVAMTTAAGVLLLGLLMKLFGVSEFESYLKQAWSALSRKVGRVPGNAAQV